MLGGLVQAAQERARRTEQVAEQRAARKEELLDAQMKSLTAKPQEWKAVAQAYLAQQALDAFRAQERSSASLPAAGQGKSPWGRVWEEIKTTFTPQPTPPPTPPTPTGTPTPSVTPTLAATATPRPPTSMPAPILTITPTPTAAPQAKGKPWWLSSSLEEAAKALVQAIPSAKVGSWRNPIPLFSQVSPGHVISFGKVSSGMLASDANPNLRLNSDGSITPSVGKQPIALLTRRADGFDFNLRNPWQQYEFAEGTVKATLSSSVTARVTWDGFWNTTVGLDVNYPEVQVNGMGVKGRLSDGWYLEYKPGRVVTYAVSIQIVVAGFLLFPEIAAAIGASAQPAYEVIKQFLTNLNLALR